MPCQKNTPAVRRSQKEIDLVIRLDDPLWINQSHLTDRALYAKIWRGGLQRMLEYTRKDMRCKGPLSSCPPRSRQPCQNLSTPQRLRCKRERFVLASRKISKPTRCRTTKVPTRTPQLLPRSGNNLPNPALRTRGHRKFLWDLTSFLLVPRTSMQVTSRAMRMPSKTLR
jgi:hypothetical protein